MSVDDFVGISPEELAEIIFNAEPKPVQSIGLFTDQSNSNLQDLFEMLVTVLMEGLETIVGDLSTADLSKLTTEHLEALNPWIQSLGFTLHSEQYNFQTDQEQYKDYYCKTLVKDELYANYFNFKNLEKNYHFQLNGSVLEKIEEKNSIEEFHTALILDKIVFKIWFTEIKN